LSPARDADAGDGGDKVVFLEVGEGIPTTFATAVVGLLPVVGGIDIDGGFIFNQGGREEYWG